MSFDGTAIFCDVVQGRVSFENQSKGFEIALPTRNCKGMPLKKSRVKEQEHELEFQRGLATSTAG
jgi:hypothetical protein